MKGYLEVEDLEVYQKLCQLHIEICDLSHAWPPEEKYEIGSQVWQDRRSTSLRKFMTPFARGTRNASGC